MEITLINHASTLVDTGEIKILTDPWFRGSAFNNGWNLIYENQKSDEEILKLVDFIWISHEHPDHFQPSFFIKNREFIVNHKIKVLFQKTKDDRVKKFLKKQGIEVIDMFHGQNLKLSNNTECIMFKAEFYDSAIFIKSKLSSYLNINDCQFSENELIKIKKKCGQIDIFFSQFSYAAWKGGKKFPNLREHAANEKLEILNSQYKIIQPRVLIPFASFIFFSHEDNFYMNDKINTIEKVSNFLNQKKINYKILSPYTPIKVNRNTIINFDDTNCKKFWSKKYDNLTSKKLNRFEQSFDVKELNFLFFEFKRKIFSKNSTILMKLISKFRILGIFQPVNIDLYDIKKKICFNFFLENLDEISNDQICDVKMHSSNLAFIFKNEFGFDTLSVNALFESSYNGFKKLVFNFGIGSYNCSGMYLSLRSMFDINVIYLVFKKINIFKKKLDNFSNN